MIANIQSGAGQDFSSARSKLAGIAPNMNRFENTMQSSLNVISGYNSSFVDITNCTSLRSELLLLEEYLCFDFNYWIYILLVLGIVSTIVLYVLTWFLCLSVHSIADMHRSMSLIARGPVYGISEKEIMPKY